jgi:hypothetical protein
MKKFYNLLGTFCLGIASLFIAVGPASASGMGTEEIPQSIKNKR